MLLKLAIQRNDLYEQGPNNLTLSICKLQKSYLHENWVESYQRHLTVRSLPYCDRRSRILSSPAGKGDELHPIVDIGK